MALICISLTTDDIECLRFIGNLDIFCEDTVPNIDVLLLIGLSVLLIFRSSNYENYMWR